MKTSSDRFWIKVDKSGECWEWTARRFPKGYGCIKVDGKNRLAHRVVIELEGSDIPSGMIVMHVCDNPACVRPDHLRIAGQSDNILDSINKGRFSHYAHPGEDHPNAKLCEQDVLLIRSIRGETQQAIADRFGISRPTVSNIRTRKTWRHV